MKKVDTCEVESASVPTKKFVPQTQVGVYFKLIIREEKEEGRKRKQILI